MDKKWRQTMGLPVNRFLMGLMVGWLSLWGDRSLALTWTDEWLNADHLESFDLNFNRALGQFRPRQGLQAWNSGSGPSPFSALDMGDGSQGDFNISTANQFGSVVATTITIDTNSHYPILVTSFNLPSGWTLRGEGSNPLDIRSQTDIVVAGTIDCDGDDGEAINADNSVIPQGGAGHCGGGSGGNGGSVTVEATNGTAGGPSLVGGLGANAANSVPVPSNVGGGGGGAYRQVATPAEDGFDTTANPWVSAGTNFRNDTFSEIGSGYGGGSGGGGGGAYSGVDGANHSSGGAGGAGGGVILLRAVRDIEISGSVFARGGQGGGTTGTLRAGGGGGGGGGSIAVWAGRDLIFTGAISASNGLGGDSGIDNADLPAGDFPDQGDGGDGSQGRTWITDKDKCGTGICPSNEVPGTLLLDEGRVQSELTSYTIVSKAIDLQNTQPILLSVTLSEYLSSGSSSTIELATGKTADFDPTGLWSSEASLQNSRIDRYLRFRITLNNQDLVDPSILESITINYEGYQKNKFNFVGACGAIASHGGSQSGAREGLWLWIGFLFLPFLLAISLRYFSSIISAS